MKEIIETLSSADNEGTESPWWILIDPSQIKGMIQGAAEHGNNYSEERISSAIAFSVEGPFFSREDAEGYLKSRRYAYSEDAVVWCCSGYRSQKYKNFYRTLEKEKDELNATNK
jgi:hypothetical protein